MAAVSVYRSVCVLVSYYVWHEQGREGLVCAFGYVVHVSLHFVCALAYVYEHVHVCVYTVYACVRVHVRSGHVRGNGDCAAAYIWIIG